MTCDDIKKLIETGLQGAKAYITGDGHHFQAVVVSADFYGKSLLEKQRMVYSTVATSIASGSLHALTIKTFTQDEWEVIAHG